MTAEMSPGAEPLAAELDEAIAQNRLALYYQPVVSLVDRVADEVEALLRWPRNGRQILAPSDFISIAKQFGLLPGLERWAIRAAFDQLAHWKRATDLDVALNISEQHVFGESLPEEIRRFSEANDVDPARLSLEIAESAIPEPGDSRLGRLSELRELGVCLTIDDYSGEVSPERIAELPVKSLKISRRITAGIPDGERQSEIAASALALGEQLDVKVIANGIESPGQLAALREMGCRYGQGFLFSIPMPANVLAQRAMPRR
jgi:EAL domain-containing protein (putative c-di-GMP-specific phosphodiesterase class I)